MLTSPGSLEEWVERLGPPRASPEKVQQPDPEHRLQNGPPDPSRVPRAQLALCRCGDDRAARTLYCAAQASGAGLRWRLRPLSVGGKVLEDRIDLRAEDQEDCGDPHPH